jgi:hypothetical protein
MYEEGGVYMDPDRLVTGRLKDLLDGGTALWDLPTYSPNGRFVDFSQDIMISGPGNPAYLLTANISVTRRRMCRSRAADASWIPPGAPQSVRCSNVGDWGPTAYMHGVSQCLTGKQASRGDTMCGTVAQHRVGELTPKVRLVSENPPFLTAQCDFRVRGETVQGQPSPGAKKSQEYDAWKRQVQELRQADKTNYYCKLGIKRDWANGLLPCH